MTLSKNESLTKNNIIRFSVDNSKLWFEFLIKDNNEYKKWQETFENILNKNIDDYFGKENKSKNKVPNYPPLTTFNKIHNRKFTVTSNISTISTTSNYSRYTKSSSLDEIDLRRFQSNNEISNYYESTGDDQNKSQSKEKQEYYLSNSREQSTQSNFSNYSTHSNLSTNGKTSKLSLENQKSDDKNIKEFNEHIIQINDK
ncbi:hypothetical protein H8356DRAFT_980934 [Neocallimastix lanati (nom. inval.)]|uniref:PH domain-containing protein n=1 Tax=Neocallimastix californiae TaxID=1754190 RepID=A0A1Y2FTG8_9FUNG|nr:hypothetical protein H8356DRAFT_980934 [Neocallimastix sp. JGI-2020a]ORY87292.1 hypothetical protein LY90DRAFT_663011 [Neocallimastix californiae]|eukprot:ORY87292.1 hypothetical protein LY90DRAFT_663011 [Neocallimastix californiae]